MPGLVAGIHAFAHRKKGVDGRDKPGHDEYEMPFSLINHHAEIHRRTGNRAPDPASGAPAGLGPRSARRAALHLIKKREPLMAPLAAALQTAIEKIEVCRTCGNIDTQNPCTVCTDPRRDASVIVAVADVADLWALERAEVDNTQPNQ